MLIHPFKDSISLPLAARSRAIFSILDIISNAEALGLTKNSTYSWTSFRGHLTSA